MVQYKYSEKGSKRMLQLLLTEHMEDLNKELKKLKLVTSNLVPVSPSIDKNGVFHEHQLNKTILRKLKIDPDALKDFWPARQPQWDGILVNKNGSEDFDTVYLIEAKSHLNESIGGKKFIDGDNSVKKDNYIKKRDSIEEFVKSTLKIDFKEKKWMETYYQIANRLAFHHKLKELLPKKTVKLIFLNFINDLTWGKQAVKTEKDWGTKYEKIFAEMGLDIDDTKRQGVIFINDIDVSSYNDGLEK